jgi:signal transduction histidine kinase
MAGASYGYASDWLLLIAIATVPLAVLAVVLQRRLARTAVAGLVVELGDQPQHINLRDALSRALGDPTLELAYWVPSVSAYVDAEGGSVELPGDAGRRIATVVRRAGEPVAALVHDAALQQNPQLVDSVCAAAALALENERLQAELRSRLSELRASRARLVEATEAERRRLERDLHDGAQQRLVSISMTLGLLESRLGAGSPTAQNLLVEAREELTLALQELRELSQGIRPSILTERGLGSALDELARRSPVPIQLDLASAADERLSDAVESCAYFVASEALANVAKHSHATEARVALRGEGKELVLEIVDDGIGGASLADGSGLRGLLDRVEGLGGRLLVTSPPGRGTTIRAEIPCG